jgi:hypothetical protein
MTKEINNSLQGETQNQEKDAVVSTEHGIEQSHPSKSQSNITIVSCVS